MATITFDTLKFVEKLKASGIPDERGVNGGITGWQRKAYPS
jgi:hypothetical protein